MRTDGKTRPGVKKEIRSSSRIMRELFERIDESGGSAASIAYPAGIHHVTLSYWKRGGRAPRLTDFENVAEVLGYRLALVPLDR